MIQTTGLPSIASLCFGLFMSFHVAAQSNSPVSTYLGQQRQELQYQLDHYTSCQASCSRELALALTDKGIEVGLAAITLLSKADSSVKGIAALSLAARVWNTGEEISTKYGVCVDQCDVLHAEIVELGRAGVLGNMLSNATSNPQVFNDPALFNLWLQNLKPIPPGDLPAIFHNDIEWDKFQRTA